LRRQSVVAISSGEAEFYGLSAAALEARYFRSVLEFLGFTVSCTVYTDSSAARGMCQRLGCGRIRHLDARALWLQQEVRESRLHVHKCKGEDNLADLATKPHPGPRFEQLLELNGICEFDVEAEEETVAVSVDG